MRDAIARQRRRTLWRLQAGDVALAVALCAVAIASVLTGNPDEGPTSVTLPAAIVSTLALACRRTSPAVTIGLLIIAGTCQTLLAETPGSLWSLGVYAIAVYSAAAYSVEALAAVLGGVFVAALLIQERIANGVDYLFILLLFGGVWLLGRLSNTWRSRVSLAERSRIEAARRAAAEERLRIARDLHDVVAHTLGAIAVQADAAEAALQVAPTRAAEPVRAIRDTAREALTEIRGVLDVLRADDERDVADSGMRAITGLVGAAQATGVDASLQVDICERELPAQIDEACFRLVQESLTNARRHAPGAAVMIRIGVEHDVLRLIITNDASTASGELTEGVQRSGYGIRGMRERVEALGGTLAAGGTASGGFEVRAEVPLPDGRPT